MNFHGITKASFVDGVGVRTVLWVSGCEHHCDGCHNASFWDPCSGREFMDSDLAYLIDCISLPYIDGLTLSGGDPMHPENRETVREIVRRAKDVTGKSIWMYTGYLWEQIKDDPVMEYVDYVVDGKYKKDLKPATYRGSLNQRIIKVRE